MLLYKLAIDAESPRNPDEVYAFNVESRYPVPRTDSVAETLEDRVTTVVDNDKGDVSPVAGRAPERLDRIHARPVAYGADDRPVGDRELEPDGAGHTEAESPCGRSVVAAGSVEADVLVELRLAGSRLVEDHRILWQYACDGVHHIRYRDRRSSLRLGWSVLGRRRLAVYPRE